MKSYNFSTTILEDQINLLVNKLKHYEVDEINNENYSPKLAQEVFDKHNNFDPTSKYDNANSRQLYLLLVADVTKG